MKTASEKLGDHAVMFALRYGWVTADILHDVDIGKQDKRLIGSVLNELHKKGFLYVDKYVASKRPKCHHRPIILFRTKRWGKEQ